MPAWQLAGLALLVVGPVLVAGATAMGYSLAAGISAGLFLYFSIALPVAIALAITGAVVLTVISANVLLLSSVLASGVTFCLLAGAAGLGVFVAFGGKLQLPGPLQQWLQPAEVAVEKPKKVQAKKDTKDEDLEDWDRRFDAQHKEPLRLEDLSPASSLNHLREFIRQEGLDLKTGGVPKIAVYEDILDKMRLRARRSKSVG